MPVQFKGLSEYDRSYKWKSLDSSDQNRRKASRWAGLRSDELGITKEPCFISKRRVPFYNPQISKSFQWEECIDLPRNECAKSDLGTNEPVKLHLELEKESLAEESMHTPDAPRLLKKSSSHSAAHRMQSADGKSPAKNLEIHAQEANKETPTSSKAIPEKYDNGSHRVLQKKAGLNITPLQHPLKMSEYKRQYERKNPAENSPMLAAEQIVYNKNKLVPPFKVNSVKTQTEYESQFKGSPPAKGPKLRKDWEEKHISEYEPENQPPKRKDKKKKINEASSSPPKMDKSEEEQEQMIQRKILKEKVLQQLNHFSKSCRKMKSEYSANFLSPSEYKYKDGAWVRIKQKGHDQGSSLSQGSMWLAEVKELREKAEYYRRRAQGTHFSREHLNQILSVNNRLWDVSSNCSSEEHVSNNIKALDLAGLQTSSKNEQMHTSPAETKSASNTGNLGDSNVPTMPVRRRLVWGENVMEPTRELEPQKMENEIEEEKCTKEMDNLEETEQLEHADNIEEKGTESLETELDSLRSKCLSQLVIDTILHDSPLLKPVFMSHSDRDPRKGMEKGLRLTQDKLLDVIGPLAQILHMVDSALTQGTPLDPTFIREWALHSFCLLGNANTALSSERRKAALLRIDSKLADLVAKEMGPSSDGLLFGEKFLKELQKHVNLFTMLNKAQTSMRKVFAQTPSRSVFGWAGPGSNHTEVKIMAPTFETDAESFPTKKGAVEFVNEPGGFFSNIFLVTKKTGGFHPVINLRRLNAFVLYHHFKMEGGPLLSPTTVFYDLYYVFKLSMSSGRQSEVKREPPREPFKERHSGLCTKVITCSNTYPEVQLLELKAKTTGAALVRLLHGTEFNPSVDGSDCTSLSSETGGRLPTPKFKSSGLALRTHHDRTTPSTGGALLVSPMKQQPQTSEEMQKSYYEKNSQNKHVSKEHIKIKEKEQSTQSPLVAGMRTVDPIPLREDPWPSNHIFNGPSSPVITYPVSRSSVQKPTVSMLQQWSPSCRIHGALKDPEFQHNGNFANPNLYKISLDVDHSIEDDRLSQISARSAASSSLASQVLERAQKRKEHFWGKK
ncbi:nuclear protein MDM1 [Rhinophrynus dorsalis]